MLRLRKSLCRDIIEESWLSEQSGRNKQAKTKYKKFQSELLLFLKF